MCGQERLSRFLCSFANAPTALMRELDYGKGYEYAHDSEEKLTAMECFPESMRGTVYYPAHRGGGRRAR